mgnify:FL=1
MRSVVCRAPKRVSPTASLPGSGVTQYGTVNAGNRGITVHSNREEGRILPARIRAQERSRREAAQQRGRSLLGMLH